MDIIIHNRNNKDLPTKITARIHSFDDIHTLLMKMSPHIIKPEIYSNGIKVDLKKKPSYYITGIFSVVFIKTFHLIGIEKKTIETDREIFAVKIEGASYYYGGKKVTDKSDYPDGATFILTPDEGYFELHQWFQKPCGDYEKKSVITNKKPTENDIYYVRDHKNNVVYYDFKNNISHLKVTYDSVVMYYQQMKFGDIIPPGFDLSGKKIDSCMITVKVDPSFLYTLDVHSQGKMVCKVKCTYMTTVKKVQEEIEKWCGIPASHQTLFISGKIAKEEDKMEKFKLSHATKIFILPPARQIIEPVNGLIIKYHCSMCNKITTHEKGYTTIDIFADLPKCCGMVSNVSCFSKNCYRLCVGYKNGEVTKIPWVAVDGVSFIDLSDFDKTNLLISTTYASEFKEMYLD